MNYKFQMLENEYWWGGTSSDGIKFPFDKNTTISHDFRLLAYNQTMPMFLSNKGRCIWSDNAFKVTVENNCFEIEGENVTLESFGSTLREAYTGAMKNHFPPTGNKLPENFFTLPQYNTWMQMTYHQTQAGVIRYAEDILANGFKPGIIIIDEGWQMDYGNWVFNPQRFPNPKEMVTSLHKMGFTVMLWLVPYVRPDGLFFINHYLELLCPDMYDKYFLRTDDGSVALVEWWNGFSAIFDLTNKYDIDMLDNQLQALMNDIGIDGFKFDGGCLDSYSEFSVRTGKLRSNTKPSEYNIAWNNFGAKYKYHEFKDTFKGGGKRVIQRLGDRNHSWDNNGIDTIIPNSIAQGLLGHPFICPDMVGGGEFKLRELNLPVDQELFVRMAQCSALFPMIQFSWAPWEAVDEYHFGFIKKAHDLHLQFADTIIELVNDAYRTGEPILRSLEYNYPHCGYERINDIFMLGNSILVAPIVKKGEKIKTIHLPEGKWIGFDKKEYEGNQTIQLPITLKDLPYFKLIQ